MNRFGLYFMVLVMIFAMMPNREASARNSIDETQANVKIALMANNYSMFFFNMGPANSFQEYLTTLAAIVTTGGNTDNSNLADAEIKDAPFNASPQTIHDSFLLDKRKRYTWTQYQDGIASSSTAIYSNEIYEEQPEWDLWQTSMNDEIDYFLVKETEEGLYNGLPYSHYYMDLKYPLFAGKTWDTSDEEINLETYTVVATDRIVTVEAGIFENVVEVKTSHGWTFYYAPTIGLIMSMKDGDVVSELSLLDG